MRGLGQRMLGRVPMEGSSWLEQVGWTLGPEPGFRI